MTWDFLIIYAHVVTTIFLVGYGLFWVVMTMAARRELPAPEASRVLGIARAAAWPPAGKLTLRLMGWLILIGVVVTGVLCLHVNRFSWHQLVTEHGVSSLFFAKLALLAALIASFPRLGSGSIWLAYLSLGLTLAIVVVSALLVR